MGKARKKAKKVKPQKPYEDFPLFPHLNGRWAKKIRGMHYYFGYWDDWENALKEYEEKKDALHAGKAPKAEAQDVRIKNVVNTFLNAHEPQVQSKEMKERTFAEYRETCFRLGNRFGKERPVLGITDAEWKKYRDDMAKKWAPSTVNREIQSIKAMFSYAKKAKLLAVEYDFGTDFKRMSKKRLRLEKASKPKKSFKAEVIRTLLEEAGQPLKVMILLALNAGFGNDDCGQLELRHLDLDNGWLDFARPKTSFTRRAKLWDETTAALREWLGMRPKPIDTEDENLVFITRFGGNFKTKVSTANLSKTKTNSSVSSAISLQFGKLLRKLSIKEKGVGFYALRHVHRTIAGRAKDPEAANFIMGHHPEHMAYEYIEEVDDDRIEDVVNVIHDWLFPPDIQDGNSNVIDVEVINPSSLPSEPGENKIKTSALLLAPSAT